MFLKKNVESAAISKIFCQWHFLEVIGDSVAVNKATVSRGVSSPGKPFESKSFAQFYEVK